MRILLDTNVLVSAFTTRGLCADVLSVVMQDHELAVSPLVIIELQRLLGEKMKLPEALIEQITDFASANVVLPEVAPQPTPRIDDGADARILAAAIAGDADVLVTGDGDLLRLADQVPEIAILSPRRFWERLKDRDAG